MQFVPSWSGGVGPCGFGEVTIYLLRLLYTLGGYYIHLEVSGSAFVFECEFVFRLFIRKFGFVIVRGVMKFSRERAEA